MLQLHRRFGKKDAEKNKNIRFIKNPFVRFFIIVLFVVYIFLCLAGYTLSSVIYEKISFNEKEIAMISEFLELELSNANIDKAIHCSAVRDTELRFEISNIYPEDFGSRYDVSKLVGSKFNGFDDTLHTTQSTEDKTIGYNYNSNLHIAKIKVSHFSNKEVANIIIGKPANFRWIKYLWPPNWGKNDVYIRD